MCQKLALGSFVSDFDLRCFSFFGGFFDDDAPSVGSSFSAAAATPAPPALAPTVCFITSECLPTTLLKVFGLSPPVFPEASSFIL